MKKKLIEGIEQTSEESNDYNVIWVNLQDIDKIEKLKCTYPQVHSKKVNLMKI